MVLRGWELRYNYYIKIRYAAPAMLPTTNAVFSQLTVLLITVFWFCAFPKRVVKLMLSPQVGLVNTFTLTPGVMWG